MKAIRKLLVKLLGIKGYLQLISSIYLKMISLGFFKKKYAELHFIQNVIKPNDVVIDIGANLGYYSYFMAKSIQENGKLLAIEPIPLFADVWKKNMRKYQANKNIKLFNVALGSKAQTAVKMSIPIVNGIVRHGLTKVDNHNVDQAALSFDVPMMVGDELLASEKVDQINYIKCDVEGYEQFVMPSLKNHIENYKPLIQIELNGKENREAVVKLLLSLDYQIHILDFNKLKGIEPEEIHTFNQDFYFIHPSKKEAYSKLTV
ncbi:hypothetical protein DNU06_01125 [Putridiphycobacter roseus]|uniref:Methyltransferase FkbM domain-containing protein n=1 Tax=Putridiphycobacter roseus TaxID=2219161 RepID=A0A2W1NG44_9FLAO|nr:FkbM family methyltransferase [Putridiphycobacter roseus]PZE18465.1 hypothetical protein DNU06_01125 [Putridiphycobacter roseus]